MAPVSRPSSSTIRPSARDRSTIDATSSAVKADATSSLGCTPTARSTRFATQFSTRISGEMTREINTSGGPNQRAARSGLVTARFFGTISPITTWRYTTIPSAIVKPTTWEAPAGRPIAISGSSIACAIAGSATTPMPVEQMVIPSCAHASMSETCSMAQSTVLADREPAAASGSICERRADMIANSAPTKKALAASSTAPISSAVPGLTGCPHSPASHHRP